MSEKRFADVSSHNPSTLAYMQGIKNAGGSGVVIKLTEGTYYFNSSAPSQIENAKKAGLVVSVYHFSRFTNESGAIAESNFFLSKIKDLGIQTNQVVINDYEAVHASTSALNKFYEPLESAGYKKIGIYFPGSWYSSGLLNGVRGLKWLAEYGVSQPRAKLDAWQYSSSTIINGVATDMSIDYTGAFTDPNATTSSDQSNDQRSDDDKKNQADKTKKEDCYSFINMLNNDIYDKWLF